MTTIGHFTDGTPRVAIRWRKDGKPAKAATGSGPSWHNGLQREWLGDRYEMAAPWGDLTGAGPTGDEDKRLAREERVRRGTVSREPRHQPRNLRPVPRRDHRARTRSVHGGKLVLHTRKPARPSGVALASPDSLTGLAQRA